MADNFVFGEFCGKEVDRLRFGRDAANLTFRSVFPRPLPWETWFARIGIAVNNPGNKAGRNSSVKVTGNIVERSFPLIPITRLTILFSRLIKRGA